jgi:tetratricopeptide (TPR) repeat protein
LATAYLADGQTSAAIPLFEDCLASLTAKLTSNHRQTTAVFRDLAWAYVDDKQIDKAIALSRKFVETLRARRPFIEGELAGALMPLGRALTAHGKPVEAEPILRECLTLREKTQPDSWPLATAQAALGGTLLELKSYEEAEPLLIAGFNGIRDRLPLFPPALRRQRLAETAGHLSRLYDATSRPDESAKWKKQVEELNQQSAKK